MPYAIELGLDRAAGAAVRRIWRELEDAGITYMARSGADPHVSLGIWERVDVAAFQAELAAFARTSRPLPVTFTSVGTFPGAAVYLAPEPTPALGEIHARCLARFAPLGSGAWAYYAPGAWVPHCTLAMDLTDAERATAQAIARRAPLPLHARLVRIGIVEFRPVKELCAFDLG